MGGQGGTWQAVGKPTAPPPKAGGPSQAPDTAMPDDRAASKVYCPTSLAKVGFKNSCRSTVSLVRNAICSGVRSSTPKGCPTWVVSNGTRPKLFAPIDENPVSC